MKVICIDGKAHPCSHNKLLHLLKEGEVYTVLKTVCAIGKDGTTAQAYVLEELFDGVTAFNTNRFAPLSDIDETEMIRERNPERSVATEVEQNYQPLTK